MLACPWSDLQAFGSRSGSQIWVKPSVFQKEEWKDRQETEACSETLQPFAHKRKHFFHCSLNYVSGRSQSVQLGSPDSLWVVLSHGPHQSTAPVVTHQGDLRDRLEKSLHKTRLKVPRRCGLSRYCALLPFCPEMWLNPGEMEKNLFSDVNSVVKSYRNHEEEDSICNTRYASSNSDMLFELA